MNVTDGILRIAQACSTGVAAAVHAFASDPPSGGLSTIGGAGRSGFGLLGGIQSSSGRPPRRHSKSLEAAPDELPWVQATSGGTGDQVAVVPFRLWRAPAGRTRSFARGVIRKAHSYQGLEQVEAVTYMADEGDLVEIQEHPLLPTKLTKRVAP